MSKKFLENLSNSPITIIVGLGIASSILFKPTGKIREQATNSTQWDNEKTDTLTSKIILMSEDKISGFEIDKNRAFEIVDSIIKEEMTPLSKAELETIKRQLDEPQTGHTR